MSPSLTSTESTTEEEGEGEGWRGRGGEGEEDLQDDDLPLLFAQVMAFGVTIPFKECEGSFHYLLQESLDQ